MILTALIAAFAFLAGMVAGELLQLREQRRYLERRKTR